MERNWKKVEEELPKEEGHYTIFFNNTVTSGYFYEGNFYHLSFDQSPDLVPVTHWMSLPGNP